MNRAKTRVIAVILGVALGGSALLSACGHKGPLYLPDDTKKEQKKEQK